MLSPEIAVVSRYTSISWRGAEPTTADALEVRQDSCIPCAIDNNPDYRFLRCEAPRTALMDGNAIIGCAVALVSLCAITGLVLWSRWCINRMAKGKPRTARQALKELNGGR